MVNPIKTTTTKKIVQKKEKIKKNIISSTDSKKVITITFDLANKKVNLLNQEVMLELNKHLDIIEQKQPKALIFRSAKKGCFIAGADINEILKMKEEKEILEKVSFGQNIFNRIENFPFPVIAIIDGMALGGGLELALACDYRIVSEEKNTFLGLPEVQLGILPGFGGTQRLPRIAKFIPALTMLISGKKITSKQALKFGIADYCFSAGYIDLNLPSLMEKMTKKRSDRKKSWEFLSLPFIRKIVLNQIENKIFQETKNHYPAPLVIVSLLKKTLKLKPAKYQKGYELEQKFFTKLAMLPVAKNLMKLFQDNQELKKDDWGNKKINEKSPIEKTAVIGAGKMGSGIAWLFGNNGKKVRLFDLNHDAIKSGFRQINDYNNQLLRYKKETSLKLEQKINNISFSTNLEKLSQVDLVIEAVSEKLEIKKKVYKNLEKIVSNKVVIASNTSSLPIKELSKNMKYPERFLGIHFFNPVNRMPLVEVIPSKKTSAEAIGAVVKTLRDMKKIVLLVKDSPGFLVNRILFAYLNEAVKILEETGKPEAIDEVFLEFGMPMGPIRLLDEVGLDVGLEVAEVLNKAFGSRMKISSLVYDMVQKEKWLGCKTKKGFFDYTQGYQKTNEKISTLIKTKRKKVPKEHILQRPIMLMINEAVRCYEEGICKKPEQIDLAMIYGIGFPPFHGGPIKYLNTLGLSKAKEIFQNLASHYGERFYACEFLKKMEQKRKKFYPENS